MPRKPTDQLGGHLPADVDAALRCITEIEGRSLIGDAQEAVPCIFAETEIVRLSVEDQHRFVEALLDPPSPNDALRLAMRLHDENVEMR